MSHSAPRILLVEGETDQSFFIELLKKLQLDPRVQVAPPKVLGARRNSKQAVFNHLPVLLQQLTDGSLTHLAVVVDADFIQDGNGYTQAVQAITAQLAPFGFSSSPQPKAGGIVFPHNDGLADFGLWVMPNNAGEGALENWFLDCAHPNSQPLLDHAKTTVANLGAYSRFKQPHHLCKAQLATWLAWEQSPGEGLWRAFRDDLLDEGNPAFQGLCAWLQYVYSQAR